MLSLSEIWYNRHFRSYLIQTIFLGFVTFLAIKLWQILHVNLDKRDIELGFGFLKDTAGFSIITHLIAYNEQSNYFRVFWVGLLNTLLVSGISILLATLFGFMIGIARLSSQKLLRFLASMMVETIRNIPLLLQLFIWYFVVLRAAPSPQNSISIFKTIYITNRGIYFPAPQSQFSAYYLSLVLLCFITIFIFFRLDQRLCLLKGLHKTYYRLLGWITTALTVCLLIAWIGTLTWEKPQLGHFNFEYGISLIPEFLALVFALSLYTSVYIGEIVRMGLLSVPQGQQEAANALGFSKWQTLKLIIIPQSLRVILPPLTNQYLNIIKNSSLATAIAYPDLVSIFAGTALNQTGQAVEIIAMTMAVYLFINLMISGLMLLYEKYTRWGNP
ncbi:MAG: ABC transporter permease subunit [Proteobacteria bacterium]|nr:ABC transporter permease subunit [Pseudomonadota bacterium]